MKVLVLGTYNLDTYTRGKVLYKGLKENNTNVELFLRTDKLRYFKIIKRLIQGNYDAVIANGRIVLFLAKIFSRKPVIFDFFISAYDTQVLDRKIVPKNSLKAKLLWLGDKYAGKFADLNLMINYTYLDFTVTEFNIPREKFRVLYLGADEGTFYPKKIKKDKKDFIVEFHGSFIPLHGVETIIDAAEILKKEKDIEFVLIGKGQMFDFAKERIIRKDLSNVKLAGWVDYSKLPEKINIADVCLGIFGTTPKAKRCITHKVFEIMAIEKPLITMRSRANEELFTNKKNAILVTPGNPKELAAAILSLKKDAKLREKIAKNSYNLFREKFTAKKIGNELKKYIKEITSA